MKHVTILNAIKAFEDATKEYAFKGAMQPDERELAKSAKNAAKKELLTAIERAIAAEKAAF